MRLAALKVLPPSVLGALLLAASSLLSACGGGDTAATPALAGAALSGEATQVAADLSTVPVQPTFHVAPVLLDEPDDTDTLVSDVSASMEPHTARVLTAMSHLSTRRLTRDAIESAIHAPPSISVQSLPSPDGAAATPLASGSVVATYTPAQIRAAYGLPSLPAATSTTSANQAAQLGAGQTIYLIDAMHNPNVASELGAFDQKFGLPGCSVTPIATNASLPLSPAATTGCALSVVYSTTNGTMTASAPAYDSGWSTEISIDVQWAHATAPFARLVLIEAPDASLTSLLAAIRLADAMGAGVVSMSFGAGEGSWTASVDNAFATAGMTYVASTGDAGPEVSWPAVSAHVLAVGGTTLTYSGSSARREVTWSSTGGGVSLYTPTPSYQTSSVPGMGVPTHRNVADVSFNADPATGQYIAVIAQGSASVGWLSAGGTSLSAPQWAGLVAVANAMRAQSATVPLGAPHAIFYSQIASIPSNYSSAFADITQGADGSCLACAAKTGYDLVTGLGTPNVAAILPLLTASSSSVTPPIVASSAVTGTAGVALSFAISATAPDTLAYTLSGAPAGMTVSSGGSVTWPLPVQGSYSITVTATDIVTGLSGKGLYTITILAPTAPVLTAATVTGTAGVALNFQVSVTAKDPVSMILSGAPTGMSINNAGLLTWATPLQGAYLVTVIAKDSTTGLSGQGVLKFVIGPPKPPVVAGATITGKIGNPLSFAISVTSPNPVIYALAGAPAGMTINSAGIVGWPRPVVGTYSVTVSATDPKTGLTGRGVYKVTIATP